jgi:hypothetical protein
MPRRLIALAAGAAGWLCAAHAGSAHAQPANPGPANPGPTNPGPANPEPANPAPAPVPRPDDTSANADPANPDTPPSADRDPVPRPGDAPANGATTTAVPETSASAEPAARDDEVGDQGVSAHVGLAGGGRVTPGGLRLAGHYLYQLADRDWFDGAATFTFGSGSAACFRDRMDQRVCGHGLADGVGVEVSASIRRLFAPQGAFRPFARAGLGIGLAQFSDDEVSGFTVALHGGGGVGGKVAPAIAVIAEGDIALGFGSFGSGVGLEPQLGFAVTAGAEFRLR